MKAKIPGPESAPAKGLKIIERETTSANLRIFYVALNILAVIPVVSLLPASLKMPRQKPL